MKDSSQFTLKILATVLFVMVLPVLACGGSSTALPTLAPTADPDMRTDDTSAGESATTPVATAAAAAGAADAATLKTQMVEELRNYDYERQQVVVEDVEFDGQELVVTIRRQGSPSMNDYFGQLGTIHGVIAVNEPDAAVVRTVDADAGNGYVVAMEDLLDFFHGRIDFETYRARWEYFEP